MRWPGARARPALAHGAMAHSKNWMFTINNPTDDNLPSTWDYKYVAWQVERGAEGTRHLQGYLQLATQKRLAAMKKIHPGAHWEQRKGTHSEAYAYVTKTESREDGPWELGSATLAAGQRNDLLAFRDAVIAGKSDSDLVQEPHLYPVWAKHERLAQRIRSALMPDKTWTTGVTVIWGVPGAGKSVKADELAGDRKIFYWSTDQWADGYAGEEVIIINDFHGWLPQGQLCNLIDPRKPVWKVKGGFVKMIPRELIITSTSPPTEWWSADKGFKRRIDRVIHMSTVYGEHPVPRILVDAYGVQHPYNPEAPMN